MKVALLTLVVCASRATSPPSGSSTTTSSGSYPTGCSWAEGAPFCDELGKACLDDLALDYDFKKFPYELGCYDFCSKKRGCAVGRHCVDVEARLNPLKNKAPRRYSVCVPDGAPCGAVAKAFGACGTKDAPASPSQKAPNTSR